MVLELLKSKMRAHGRPVRTYTQSVIVIAVVDGSDNGVVVRQSGKAGQVLRDREARHFERALIEAELRKNMGDVLATSEMLSVPIKTLYDKMQRHTISSEMYKGMHTKSFLR